MATIVGTLVNSLRYRGRDGQWAWMLHRVSGLGVMLFLLLHIVDIFLMAAGKETFEKFMAERYANYRKPENTLRNTDMSYQNKINENIKHNIQD